MTSLKALVLLLCPAACHVHLCYFMYSPTSCLPSPMSKLVLMSAGLPLDLKMLQSCCVLPEICFASELRKSSSLGGCTPPTAIVVVIGKSSMLVPLSASKGTSWPRHGLSSKVTTSKMGRKVVFDQSKHKVWCFLWLGEG